jgi:hypothetical protein
MSRKDELLALAEASEKLADSRKWTLRQVTRLETIARDLRALAATEQ